MPLNGMILIVFIENYIMEKRILGIILTLLGVVGLIIAGVSFMNKGDGAYNIKTIVMYGI